MGDRTLRGQRDLCVLGENVFYWKGKIAELNKPRRWKTRLISVENAKVKMDLKGQTTNRNCREKEQ